VTLYIHVNSGNLRKATLICRNIQQANGHLVGPHHGLLEHHDALNSAKRDFFTGPHRKDYENFPCPARLTHGGLFALNTPETGSRLAMGDTGYRCSEGFSNFPHASRYR